MPEVEITTTKIMEIKDSNGKPLGTLRQVNDGPINFTCAYLRGYMYGGYKSQYTVPELNCIMDALAKF